ncbi:arsenate reductase (glutaredoxin) [Acidisoma silvae]|uniref:Arsenate reductase n=1 Tax=Acidisoma silvae TaxID=2802396 RepID=A0A963YUC2_9PROT|nr:arsenate reductase (glutaredoxin) [Acidisoma silvae]MCB8877228.1 arsenate reductase (glutaredoxin) [Acidisoma silvae]
MTKSKVTIFHNPACGTSRRVLGMIEAAGMAPEIVLYLKTGWTRPQLLFLLASMKARPRDILRKRGTPAEELGLLAADTTDDAILDAMVAHPVLVERPIVVTPRGAKLCRPAETVEDLL